MNILIRQELKKRHQTQKELANYLGISESALSRKMSNARDFKWCEILEICQFLNVECIFQEKKREYQ